jgi:hypothetical protein
MPDEVDDLILKMQHLEAQARESQTARHAGVHSASLKSRAAQMAAQAQTELDAAQKEQAEGEAAVQRAHAPGLAPLEAADLLASGRAKAQEGKTRAIKARARLDFALGQMDETDHQAWDAMQAEARAETHAQLAESGADSSRMPTAADLAGAGTGA